MDILGILEDYPATTQVVMWLLVLLITYLSGALRLVYQLSRQPILNCDTAFGFLLLAEYERDSKHQSDRSTINVEGDPEEAGDQIGNYERVVTRPKALHYLYGKERLEKLEDLARQEEGYVVAICVRATVLNPTSAQLSILRFWLRFRTRSGSWSRAIPIEHFPERPTFPLGSGYGVHLIFYTTFEREKPEMREYTVSTRVNAGDKVSGFLLFVCPASSLHELPDISDGTFEVALFAQTVSQICLTATTRGIVKSERVVRDFCRPLIEHVAVDRTFYRVVEANERSDIRAIGWVKHPMWMLFKRLAPIAILIGITFANVTT